MKFTATVVLVLLTLVGYSEAGKQKIILHLREPLKAETVKIVVPGVEERPRRNPGSGNQGRIGRTSQDRSPQNPETTLKLDLAVRSIGKNGVQVTMTLPNPGFVEVVMMDFYGKSLATLFAGNLARESIPCAPSS